MYRTSEDGATQREKIDRSDRISSTARIDGYAHLALGICFVDGRPDGGLNVEHAVDHRVALRCSHKTFGVSVEEHESGICAIVCIIRIVQSINSCTTVYEELQREYVINSTRSTA